MDYALFTNRYQLSKTLQFSLIPCGRTEEVFHTKRLLEEDEERAKNYAAVKEIADRYHKKFIDQCLDKTELIGLKEYAGLYYLPSRTEEDKDAMVKLEADMRKQIAVRFTGNGHFKELTGKDLIEKYLPDFCTEDGEKAAVSSFKGFSTYFSNYHTNRKNMYSAEAKATAVSYRLINENLPKYLDNVRAYARAAEALPAEETEGFFRDFRELFGDFCDKVFAPEGFSLTLTQSGIDRYNQLLGGYTCSDKTKVQGLNERINLFNQQIRFGEEGKKKIPFLKPLFKQILSDRETLSFLPEAFKTDDALLSAVREAYRGGTGDRKSLEAVIGNLFTLFDKLNGFEADGIYLLTKRGALTDLSQAVCGDWNRFRARWEEEYRLENPPKKGKDPEKYAEEIKKNFQKNDSFSLARLTALCGDSVVAYYTAAVRERVDTVRERYAEAASLLTCPYTEPKKLCANEDAIERLKNFLDSLKDLERLLLPLLGTGKEENRDPYFYGEFEPLLNDFSVIDRLYDKVRNYVTKKPYSKDKIKLNFGNPNLLSGWLDSFTEKSDNGTQYGGYLFRKKNAIGEYDYFLGVSKNARLFRSFTEVGKEDESEFERLDYYQPKGQSIYGSSYCGNYGEDKKAVLQSILRFAEKTGDGAFLSEIRGYVEGENPTPMGCYKRIRENFPQYEKALKKDKAFSVCNRIIIDHLKETMSGMHRLAGAEKIAGKEYGTFAEIMAEIDELASGRSFRYFHVSASEMEDALSNDEKPLYLFKISNKDLSYADTFSAGIRKSRGIENLHTMYFKALMSGEQSVFDLGTGELFYRKPSIKDAEKIVHPANRALENKNPDNETKASVFPYDLTKDKRFTERQFSLHLSMVLNYAREKKDPLLDYQVRKAIGEAKEQYVIGIDRGERNLLYICVINGKNEIVEQKSLNEIVSGNGHRVDYQKLLDRKEKERDEKRKSWGTVEGIKELKEGYMSLVIHEICTLAVKYHAVIAMEDLNAGFMRSRFKVEKQVYTKFEKMLTEKLNYLADKKQEDVSLPGGLLNAYQLTNKTDKVRSARQDGILFYVPAWMTSKIDPTTGFVDLLNTRYESVEKAKAFFGAFDAIRYCPKEGMFAFDVDYEKLPTFGTSAKTKWRIYTNGERIHTFRNPEKNGEWDSKTVDLTAEFRELFTENGIPLSGDMKGAITAKSEPQFFGKLMKLFSLTLQMRNSVTGTDIDYLISPVKNGKGGFFDSRDRDTYAGMPQDADANGAYNIARKCRMIVDGLKNAGEEAYGKMPAVIRNADWLAYAQKQ